MPIPPWRMVGLTLTHGMVQADSFGRFHLHNGVISSHNRLHRLQIAKYFGAEVTGVLGASERRMAFQITEFPELASTDLLYLLRHLRIRCRDIEPERKEMGNGGQNMSQPVDEQRALCRRIVKDVIRLVRRYPKTTMLDLLLERELRHISPICPTRALFCCAQRHFSICCVTRLSADTP